MSIRYKDRNQPEDPRFFRLEFLEVTCPVVLFTKIEAELPNVEIFGQLKYIKQEEFEGQPLRF